MYKGGRGSVGSVDFPLLRWGLGLCSKYAVAVCDLRDDRLLVCLVIAL